MCRVLCDIRYKVLCSEKSWRVNQNRNSETSRLNSIKKVTWHLFLLIFQLCKLIILPNVLLFICICSRIFFLIEAIRSHANKYVFLQLSSWYFSISGNEHIFGRENSISSYYSIFHTSPFCLRIEAKILIRMTFKYFVLK